MTENELRVVNGAMMLDRKQAHEELASALQLPAYYGRNLDALWDLASTMSAYVVMTDTARMLNALGSYGCKLLQTLYEAARENPQFKFTAE